MPSDTPRDEKIKTRKKIKVRQSPDIEVDPSLGRAPDARVTVEDKAVFSFCRMNPPTKGHQKLIDTIHNIAEEIKGTPLVFLSHTTGDKNNPLTYKEKFQLVREAFGDIVQKSDVNNILDIIKDVSTKYNELHIVVGEDQVDSLTRMLSRASVASHLQGKPIFVHNAGRRTNIISEDLQSVSASRVREAARSGNIELMKQLMPDNICEKSLKSTYNNIINT